MQDQQPVQPDTTILPKNGQSQSINLSTNSTLFWRLFVPVFGTVFCTGFLLAFTLTDEEDLYLPMIPVLWARVLVAILWLGWIYFLYRTLWRLKRVDATDTHVYVTNYWTTVRYLWEDVDHFEEKRPLGRRVVNMWLKSSGRFGQIISFLPGNSYDRWRADRKEEILAN